jgi:hypothetical protein
MIRFLMLLERDLVAAIRRTRRRWPRCHLRR